MPWMIREDKLDADQKYFVDEESRKEGNIWIKGFAGSGKSVLLAHSLKKILNKEPNAKVVVVVYTHSLIDMFNAGISELGISRQVPVKTYYEFVDRDSNQYDYIFCDEVQDLPARVLYEMKRRAKKIIVAGDSNQSIYDTDPKWFEETVDPDTVGDILNARPFLLSMIHRLTRSIIAAVNKLLPNMNIFGSKRDLTKTDVQISICEASSAAKEVQYISKESEKPLNVGESCVALFPKHKYIVQFINLLLKNQSKPTWEFKPVKWDISKPVDKQRPDYDDLNNHLSRHGLKVQYVGNGHGSFKEAEAKRHLILMTYHSAKGLDFDNVFIPFINASMDISRYNEETLFMVAITRSRKNLYLTYSGYTHDLVDKFKDECVTINVEDILNPRTTTNRSTTTFDF